MYWQNKQSRKAISPVPHQWKRFRLYILLLSNTADVCLLPLRSKDHNIDLVTSGKGEEYFRLSRVTFKSTSREIADDCRRFEALNSLCTGNEEWFMQCSSGRCVKVSHTSRGQHTHRLLQSSFPYSLWSITTNLIANNKHKRSGNKYRGKTGSIKSTHFQSPSHINSTLSEVFIGHFHKTIALKKYENFFKDGNWTWFLRAVFFQREPS